MTGSKATIARRAARKLRGAVTSASLRTLVIATTEETGALPEQVVEAINPGGRRSRSVDFLVLDFVPGLPPAIPSGVRGHVFWQEAAPDIGRYIPEPPDAGLTKGPVPGSGGQWREGFYRDGRPELSITDTGIEHHEPSGATIRRDEFDGDGHLVRTVAINPSSGLATAHRYLANDGSCWLTVKLEDDETPAQARQFRPQLRSYPTLESVQADWVQRYLGSDVPPVALAAGPTSARVAALLRRQDAPPRPAA